MKSTRASVQPAERNSVTRNQSLLGVSRAKLAPTNTPPPLHSPHPLCTQDESVSKASSPPEAHALPAEWKWLEAVGQQIPLKGPSQILLVLLTGRPVGGEGGGGVTMTHSNTP